MAERPLRPVRRLVRGGESERAQRSRSDGAGDRRRRRPAVGADGAAEGPRAGRLRLLHQCRQPQGRRARRQSATPRCCSTGSRCAARCGSKAAVEPVSTPKKPTPISPRAARDSQIGAWASDQSRPLDSRADLRSALRARWREQFEGQRRSAPAALGGLPRRAASGSSSGATARTGSTSAGCSTRPTAAGAKGCSTRDGAHRATIATPSARRCRRGRRSPASRWRCSCSASKPGRRSQTRSMAMLGSLADTALDLIASLVTLSACGSPPSRPTAIIASATARPRRWSRWSRSSSSACRRSASPIARSSG